MALKILYRLSKIFSIIGYNHAQANGQKTRLFVGVLLRIPFEMSFFLVILH